MNSNGNCGRNDNRFSKPNRIKSNREIREAYAQGDKYVGKNMVFWLRRGDNASLRLAVVSSRKVGNAVKRNRARRLLRECYRTNRKKMTGTEDIVLVARKQINDSIYKEVEKEFIRLADRAGLTGKRDI